MTAVMKQKEWLKSQIHKAALEYVERGWSIFPIGVDSKRPLNSWKEYQTRRPTEKEVNEWFELGAPTQSGERVDVFNLALVTGDISGVLVVDADNEESVMYCLENKMASSYIVKTARGRHFYWKHPGGAARYPNKVGCIAHDWPNVKGLDFRGDGGYVLLPPSVSFNADGTFKHSYEWYIEDDWEYLPEWNRSAPSLAVVTENGEFNFEAVRLNNVQLKKPEDYLPVWEQADMWVHRYGRKMVDGDGRNTWLARYAGEMVQGGNHGVELQTMCRTFMDTFFDIHLPDFEFNRTLRSVEESDRKNHPERYNEDGTPIKKEASKPVAVIDSAMDGITFDDLTELEKHITEIDYFLDPVVAPGQITQIVGFNGHGKSMIANAMLWGLSVGRPFGPYHVHKPAKVLYFDFETPAKTLKERMEKFGKSFGNPSKNYIVATQNTPNTFHKTAILKPLNTEEGFAAVGNWVQRHNPDVVVIDTVRSAFYGMEENSPADWAIVNHVAKTIRNTGAAVILIHHRNKPGENGLGREAGSTAQLTDIDTQVIVTQVYRTKDDAKVKAGLWDSDLEVQDFRGKAWSPFAYLEQLLEPDSRLMFVTQVSYGKVRSYSDNHTTQFIGWAERFKDGSMYIVSTKSQRQKAHALAATGMSAQEVAYKLQVPVRVINDWLK